MKSKFSGSSVSSCSKKSGRLHQDSQCFRILRRLRGRNWVTMPALVRASGSFNIHSRIDELRHVHGCRIVNRVDVTVRPHVSRYRLLSNPPGACAKIGP
jgi:hypothetical protein